MKGKSLEEKRAILARRLRERASRRAFPLTYAQERLWFLEQLDPGSADVAMIRRQIEALERANRKLN
mgnify:CR=1 FL=1